MSENTEEQPVSGLAAVAAESPEESVAKERAITGDNDEGDLVPEDGAQ